jgi:hypothetical protein
MGVSEVRCSCGRWVWGPPGAEVPGWSTAGGPTRQRRAYCWGCRSELGEAERIPFAEPMVPAVDLQRAHSDLAELATYAEDLASAFETGADIDEPARELVACFYRQEAAVLSRAADMMEDAEAEEATP